MSPNAEGRGELQDLSQWVQLYTGAQMNFGDLTPYLTYGTRLHGFPLNRIQLVWGFCSTNYLYTDNSLQFWNIVQKNAERLTRWSDTFLQSPGALKSIASNMNNTFKETVARDIISTFIQSRMRDKTSNKFLTLIEDWLLFWYSQLMGDGTFYLAMRVKNTKSFLYISHKKLKLRTLTSLNASSKWMKARPISSNFLNKIKNLEILICQMFGGTIPLFF